MGGSRVQIIGWKIILPDGQLAKAQAAVDLRGGACSRAMSSEGHSAFANQDRVIGDRLVAVWISDKIAQVNCFWRDTYSTRIEAEPGNLSSHSCG